MKTKDMTSGHPFKILLFFAIPMILSVTLQQLYNLADNFIAGHFITNLNSFEAVGIVYPVTVVFLDIAVGFGVGVGDSLEQRILRMLRKLQQQALFQCLSLVLLQPLLV